MSDPIQMPTSAAAIARIAPVRPEPQVEPAKRTQTDNDTANDRREREPTPSDRQLSITRDKAANTFVYRSIEAESGDVVWQWPAEDMLRRAQHLRALEERRREEVHKVNEKA